MQVIYSALINACARARDGRGALAALREMLSEDLKPNLIVFNTALNALQRSGGSASNENRNWKRDRANELLGMMRERGLHQDNFTLCGIYIYHSREAAD
jgi:pentatricopeptide repeat protein